MVTVLKIQSLKIQRWNRIKASSALSQSKNKCLPGSTKTLQGFLVKFQLQWGFLVLRSMNSSLARSTPLIQFIQVKKEKEWDSGVQFCCHQDRNDFCKSSKAFPGVYRLLFSKNWQNFVTQPHSGKTLSSAFESLWSTLISVAQWVGCPPAKGKVTGWIPSPVAHAWVAGLVPG